jgi:hypothetical protein
LAFGSSDGAQSSCEGEQSSCEGEQSSCEGEQSERAETPLFTKSVIKDNSPSLAHAVLKVIHAGRAKKRWHDFSSTEKLAFT